MFRFLHLADLHLDSVYGGSRGTVRRLREATQEALVRATTLALDDGLDAVLVAGDAFDDQRLGYEARGVFRRELERLARGGVTVVYVTGNHDPGTARGRAAGLGLRETRDAGTAPIHLVQGGAPRVIRIARRGGAATAPRAGLVLAAGHDGPRVTTNLVREMAPLAAELNGSERLPRVGLVHSQVGSAAGADGHQPYAPSTVADMLALDLNYWALGHVHVRGRVDPAVPAYYPGNLQGRNAREHGPKGGLLVELDGDGLIEEPEFVPLAPVEFFRCELGPLDARTGEPWTSDSAAESLAEAIAARLDEAAASGEGPVARELIIRAEFASTIEIEDDLEAAVCDELRASVSGAFGEFLEVQLRRQRISVSGAQGNESMAELLETLTGHPSALGAALAECAARDQAEGSTLMADLLARIAAHPRR